MHNIIPQLVAQMNGKVNSLLLSWHFGSTWMVKEKKILKMWIKTSVFTTLFQCDHACKSSSTGHPNGFWTTKYELQIILSQSGLVETRQNSSKELHN